MVSLDVLIVHQILFAYLLLASLFLIFHLDNLHGHHRHGFFGQLIRVKPIDVIFAWKGLGAHFVDHAHAEVIFRCRLSA